MESERLDNPICRCLGRESRVLSNDLKFQGLSGETQHLYSSASLEDDVLVLENSSKPLDFANHLHTV